MFIFHLHSVVRRPCCRSGNASCGDIPVAYGGLVHRDYFYTQTLVVVALFDFLGRWKMSAFLYLRWFELNWMLGLLRSYLYSPLCAVAVVYGLFSLFRFVLRS